MSDQSITHPFPFKLAAVPGFPGYWAGEDGRVYSQWRQKGNGTGKGSTHVIGDRFRPLRMSTNDRGYFHVKMSRDRKQHTRRVNRVVLEAFVGPCPPGHEACHDNGSRQDNRPSNLRWGTARQNQADRVRHGTSNQGERHPMARLTAEQAKEIRRLYESDVPARLIAEQYGISTDYARNIGKRLNWRCV